MPHCVPDELTESPQPFELDEREMVLDGKVSGKNGKVSGKRRVIAPPLEADRLWTPEEVAHFLGVPRGATSSLLSSFRIQTP